MIQKILKNRYKIGILDVNRFGFADSQTTFLSLKMVHWIFFILNAQFRIKFGEGN